MKKILIISAVVVGLLFSTAVIIPVLGTSAKKAHYSEQASNLRSLAALYQIFRNTNGRPPKNIAELKNPAVDSELFQFKDREGNKFDWIMNPVGLGDTVILASPEFEHGERKLILIYDTKKDSVIFIHPETEPNQAPETTILTVTDRAPSSTLRASEDRVSP